MACAVGAQTVFVGGDASAHAQTRRRRLERECAAERIDLRVLNTVAIVPPRCVAPNGRDHYRVFTPYWRRWQTLPLRGVLPGARARRAAAGSRAGRTADAPFADLACIRRPNWSAAASERAATGLRAYASTRARASARTFTSAACRRSRSRRERGINQAATHSCASSAGATSSCNCSRRTRRCRARTCVHAASAGAATAKPSRAGARAAPATRSWTPACGSWRAKAGSSNRARLIVASFLTKTLEEDWRDGAAHFARLLVDADVANNVGNWQWMAGTGVDTRPNRVLNPVRQAKRHDPDGAYVRRYVPELADVDAAYVHEPWKAPAAAVPPDYPPPIDVDAAAA